MKLDIGQVYRIAWRSFSKWWIPLCLVSLVIVVCEIIPRYFMAGDFKDLIVLSFESIGSFFEGDFEKTLVIQEKLMIQIPLALKNAGFGLTVVFPIVAVFTVILLLVANKAVDQKKHTKKPFFYVLYIALVHVVISILTAIAFLFLIAPGIFLYVRLHFVPLLMIEKKQPASKAIATSFAITKDYFAEVFLIIVINTVAQLLSLPTIVGAIPATGFANTARTVTFKQLMQKYREINKE